MSEYTEYAKEFLKDTGTKFSIEHVDYGPYFHDDKESRDVYRFTLRRNGKSYSGRFGQSINGTQAGEIPTAYDVLACLTKYEPGTFENFCSEFGYDTDSRLAEKIYRNVVKEWNGVQRVFGDVLDQLAEIQ